MPRGDSIADREPCPWRIIDDVGGAFSMGAIGGGIWHLGRGSWTAPKNTKFMGGITALQARAPVLGGQFAVWGGLFACCDCSLTAIRQKVSRPSVIYFFLLVGKYSSLRLCPLSFVVLLYINRRIRGIQLFLVPQPVVRLQQEQVRVRWHHRLSWEVFCWPLLKEWALC